MFGEAAYPAKVTEESGDTGVVRPVAPPRRCASGPTLVSRMTAMSRLPRTTGLLMISTTGLSMIYPLTLRVYANR
ncbi:hypothetical protein AWB94_31435 [Mycolicibacterium canariasense]|nr:hypothetical protein AWB94_31435 [Mycolicibacterium canariasense]